MSPTERTPRSDRQGSAPSHGVLLLPPAIVLALAMLGSLSVHLPIYAGLGALAEMLERTEPQPAPPPIEISLIEPAPSETPSEASEATAEQTEEPEQQEAPVDPEPERPRRERRPRPRPERAPEPERPPEPEPPPPTVPQVAPVPPAPPPPPPPPPPQDDRRAIIQRSDDPPPEPPPDARFLAEQSRVVEEETVASITNSIADDPEPSAGEQHEGPSEEPGDSDEDRIADLRDVEGDDRRRPLPEETRRRPPREREASVSPRPTPAGAESLDPGQDQQAREGSRVRTEQGGARATGGGERAEQETITISDGFGTFTVTRPRERPEGEGEGEGGGVRTEGRGLGTAGEGVASGRPGRRRGGARRGGAEGLRGGPSLSLSWSQFESIYGEEELRRAREARLEERRSRARGSSRDARWQQFRAAIENYVSEVRPGNQTALNAAASPFATFLADMHRRIHREYADRYLASIPPDASEGLNDMSLATTLEIAVNRDGTVHSVGVVATSGNILFDFGAFNAVMRAQPFPVPPEIILSGDGRAWLHWRFDRGPRQCGTWNARPFMLDNAPRVDRGEPPEPEE